MLFYTSFRNTGQILNQVAHKLSQLSVLVLRYLPLKWIFNVRHNKSTKKDYVSCKENYFDAVSLLTFFPSGSELWLIQSSGAFNSTNQWCYWINIWCILADPYNENIYCPVYNPASIASINLFCFVFCFSLHLILKIYMFFLLQCYFSSPAWFCNTIHNFQEKVEHIQPPFSLVHNAALFM